MSLKEEEIDAELSRSPATPTNSDFASPDSDDKFRKSNALEGSITEDDSSNDLVFVTTAEKSATSAEPTREKKNNVFHSSANHLRLLDGISEEIKPRLYSSYFLAEKANNDVSCFSRSFKQSNTSSSLKRDPIELFKQKSDFKPVELDYIEFIDEHNFCLQKSVGQSMEEARLTITESYDNWVQSYVELTKDLPLSEKLPVISTSQFNQFFPNTKENKSQNRPKCPDNVERKSKKKNKSGNQIQNYNANSSKKNFANPSPNNNGESRSEWIGRVPEKDSNGKRDIKNFATPRTKNEKKADKPERCQTGPKVEDKLSENERLKDSNSPLSRNSEIRSSTSSNNNSMIDNARETPSQIKNHLSLNDDQITSPSRKDEDIEPFDSLARHTSNFSKGRGRGQMILNHQRSAFLTSLVPGSSREPYTPSKGINKEIFHDEKKEKCPMCPKFFKIGEEYESHVHSHFDEEGPVTRNHKTSDR